MRQTWGSSQSRPTSAPVTLGMLVLVVAGFLAIWVRQDIMQGFALMYENLSDRPWTVLTHPFANGSFIGVALSGLWLYQVGGIIERDIQSLRLAIATLCFILLSSALVILGSVLLGVSGLVYGIYPYLAGLTVAWATRSPNSEIRFWGVVPLKLKWLAWFSAGVVFFSAPPQLAPFLALPLGLVWLVAADKTPIPYSARAVKSRAEKKREEAKIIPFLDEVKKREKRRQEDEKLRQLFDGTHNDDR